MWTTTISHDGTENVIGYRGVFEICLQLENGEAEEHHVGRNSLHRSLCSMFFNSKNLGTTLVICDDTSFRCSFTGAIYLI
jgi:hypothetical protein